MKIEMGESLFYSWLRHVKKCQIVQTNWTSSSQWQVKNKDRLEDIMSITKSFFLNKYGYKIFKKTSSLAQLLTQAECDVIGIEIQEGKTNIYAVDVAFHEGGLNYGSREETIQKIISKSLRTAMCIYGYLDSRKAEIIFASPKLSKSMIPEITRCLFEAQSLMGDLGYEYSFGLLANEDFQDKVLDPILAASKGIADTNELFIRSYQMIKMFEKNAGIK